MKRRGIRVFQGCLLLVFLLLGAASGATHTVAKSETFYSIARKHGISVKALMSANSDKDPKLLQIGQKLKIPAKGSSTSSRPRVNKKSLRVVVDAGHGGKDHGAVWSGVRESDLNLRVASRVERDLKARGYTVIMTRRSDVYLSLAKRAQISNRYSNSIFVSIHFNATSHTSVRGAETFYAGTKGRYLAQSIQKELVRKLKVRNRGVVYRKYSVLRQTASPAVLVECGFISNSYERSRCVTSKYQSLASQAIVAGIERYDRTY